MNIIRQPIITILVAVAIFLLLAWYFSNIFLYIVISLVLATLLRPFTNYIARTQFFNIRVPRVFAVFISFTILITILSLFVLLFLPLISEQIRIFSNVNYEVILDRITMPIVRIENYLIENGWTNDGSGFLIEDMRSGLTKFITGIDLSSILENVISLTGSFFLLIMAVTFITFFLLFEEGILRKQFLNLIPNYYFEVTIAGFYKIERLLSNYLLGLLFQMTSIFTIAFAGLSILGIKYAASIALFAAVSNLIPYLGPILGSLFGILVGLSTSSTAIFASNEYIILIVKIVSVFAVIQLTDNLLLQPLIFSKSVKAHPLEIFIIIFAGATVAGIPGMIAAIPVYTVVRVLAMEFYRGYKSYHIFKIK